MNTEETGWVDASSPGDREASCSRFVKVIGVEGGAGRAIRIELVAEAGAKAPPDKVVPYAFYEWLREGGARNLTRA